MIRDGPSAVTADPASCSNTGQAPQRLQFFANSFHNRCGYLPSLSYCERWSGGFLAEGGPVESNERYYRRRAVEERMAAQRAITEAARAWHAKLAEDFAARANDGPVMACTQTAVTA